jgi:hypothetical protein
MLKKTFVICLLLIAAVICLPFGYGIWNESLGITANITFAEPTESVSVSEELETGEILASDAPEANVQAPPSPAESLIPSAEIIPSEIPEEEPAASKIPVEEPLDGGDAQLPAIEISGENEVISAEEPGQ